MLSVCSNTGSNSLLLWLAEPHGLDAQSMIKRQAYILPPETTAQAGVTMLFWVALAAVLYIKYRDTFPITPHRCSSSRES